MSDDSQIKDLLAKGDGVLTKRGDVWSYPGCPTDRSGTNLVLPLEYVSDAVVQKALSDGMLSAAVLHPTGYVSAVRMTDDGVQAVTAALAGSAEMGTETRPNARVESDAGAGAVTQAEVEKQVTDGLTLVANKPKPAEAKPAAKAK